MAYTVCKHFGMDTSEYSFGYLASWSSGKDLTELKASMDTIKKTASAIISGLEEKLQELSQNKESIKDQMKRLQGKVVVEAATKTKQPIKGKEHMIDGK